MMTVLKIGGASLRSVADLEFLASRIALFDGPLVIVHGGGPMINAECEKRGVTWQFIDGQRVTTPAIMQVIQDVLWGTVNPMIVDALKRHGVQATSVGIGTSLFLCEQEKVSLGLVGRVQAMKPLCNILGIPVIAPIGCSFLDSEVFLNVNADAAASQVARSLHAQKLIYLTDQEGILVNGIPLRTVDTDDLSHLVASGIISGGMSAKVRAVRDALDSGVPEVRIMHARQFGTMAGTRCIQSVQAPVSLAKRYCDAAKIPIGTKK